MKSTERSVSGGSGHIVKSCWPRGLPPWWPALGIWLLSLVSRVGLPQGCPVRLPWLTALFLQCMDRSIALTQARYLEREEKCLPPPRLVTWKYGLTFCSFSKIRVRCVMV